MGTAELVGLRCLIVDDEPSVRYVLARILGAAGMTIEEAVDGQEGLQRIEDRVPDLVVLDLHMPHVDGVGVLKELQRRGVRVPVVATSGMDTLDDVGALPDEAVQAYLEKPFSRAEVLSAVRNAIHAGGGAPV